MKNKKGFTLVELLAVIVILALLITIAVPGTRSISQRLKNKMYCSKLDFIETAATLYGEDHRDNFDLTNQKEITVKELVDTKYLKKDQENSPYIQDPRNKKSTNLYNQSLTIYLKNNRVNVSFNNSNDAKNCGKIVTADPTPPEIPEIVVSVLQVNGLPEKIKIGNIGGSIDYIYIKHMSSESIDITKSLYLSDGATAELDYTNKEVIIKWKGLVAKKYAYINVSVGNPTTWRPTMADSLVVPDNTDIFILKGGISYDCPKNLNCAINVMKGNNYFSSGAITTSDSMNNRYRLVMDTGFARLDEMYIYTQSEMMN